MFLSNGAVAGQTSNNAKAGWVSGFVACLCILKGYRN